MYVPYDKTKKKCQSNTTVNVSSIQNRQILTISISSVGWWGKKSLDLIGEVKFSKGEERLLAHADPHSPDTGTYAAKTRNNYLFAITVEGGPRK